MRKWLMVLSTIVLTVLMFTACSSDSTNVSKEETTIEKKEVLVEKSDSLLSSLESHDWVEISKEMHPEGLVFTLFADLGNSNEVLLSKEELIADSDKEIVWGKDLADREIVATKEEFVDTYLFQTIFGEDVNYSEVNLNESSVHSGGVINTIPTKFPEAQYVEYFSPASDKELDWQALRFVYQEHEEEWLLYAIVRDVHNP
ncbi:hypothetical protein [Sutcliffiella deserti]|uniref:hypothetical protein n=1 Tax=Sutcliffiella deserti TaxID=2875501 RepID=UPI001CC11A20|nr:hypothetical protein [Sutcliffiella deserti]